MAYADLREYLPGAIEERRDPLHSENLRRKLRKQRRLVSRAGSNLEDLLLSGEVEQLEISRVNRRLRNRLAVADRKRGILVGTMPDSRRHKEVTRRFRSGPKTRVWSPRS